MFYIDLLVSLFVLLILVTIVIITIPIQKEMLSEAIRQEKAQIIAENMFWETINDTSLQYLPQNFMKEFVVEIDGKNYVVTINAEKIVRQK
ncbi:MAG: hypothetical protein ACP5KD_08500 [Fervidobacterium sp.]|jgi:Na+-transporting NADH:ubiquinone oxidoreductase subunit NqrC